MTAPSDSTEWKTSELFNKPDANLIFRSSDKILFHIHSRNLENTTGGFSIADFVQAMGVIDLAEDAATLELLFQFVYPQRQPLVGKLKFEPLSKLAEAVEKYIVYPAQPVCNAAMAKFLPKHALKVLEYAVKHEYPELCDQAATLIMLPEVMAALDTLPPVLANAWLRYYAMWRHQISVVQAFTPGICCGHNNWFKHNINILANFLKFQGIPATGEILEGIVMVPDSESRCCVSHARRWRESMLEHIKGLPAFSEFLRDPPQQVDNIEEKRARASRYSVMSKKPIW